MKVLIRTDGSVQIGNGHIIRMQALASELSMRGIEFAFAIKQDGFWISTLRQKGFTVWELPADIEAFYEIIASHHFTHLVYDTRNDLTVDQLRQLKDNTHVKVVVIDSPEDVRLKADAVVFPPIPQIKEWSWDGFTGKIYSGWEYVLLRNQFSATGPKGNTTGRVLLSFGSTDPFELTEWTLERISQNELLAQNYVFVIMLGPQFNRLDKIKGLESFKALKTEIVQAPPDVTEIFRTVDFALIALGVTAYELAAMSIPFLYICISADHARSGRVFEEAKLGFPLGTIGIDLDGFGPKVEKFINQLSETKENLTAFRRVHQISDWSKIIAAIVGEEI